MKHKDASLTSAYENEYASYNLRGGGQLGSGNATSSLTSRSAAQPVEPIKS